MDKTNELLRRCAEEIDGLKFSVEDLRDALYFAQHHYDKISDENVGGIFGQEDPFGEVEYHIEYAAEYTEDFQYHLKSFDEILASLIELRGKIAEEVGIPMMSHLGDNNFARHDKEYTL